MRLDGKRIFFMAAGAGIGAATAGARLADAARAFAADIEPAGPSARAHAGAGSRVFDVRKDDAVDRFAALKGTIDAGGGVIAYVASVVSRLIAARTRCGDGTTQAAVLGKTTPVCRGRVQGPSRQLRAAAQGAGSGGVETAWADFVARQTMGRITRPDGGRSMI